MPSCLLCTWKNWCSGIQNAGLTPFDFFKYLQVSDALERIADEAKRLSRYLRRLEADDKTKQEILALYHDIVQQYYDAIEAFYANDIEKAFTYASKDKVLRERCDALSANCKNSCDDICVITEKLKTMNYCIHSIGREIYQ